MEPKCISGREPQKTFLARPVTRSITASAPTCTVLFLVSPADFAWYQSAANQHTIQLLPLLPDVTGMLPPSWGAYMRKLSTLTIQVGITALSQKEWCCCGELRVSTCTCCADSCLNVYF
jgi:hypothetical protein